MNTSKERKMPKMEKSPQAVKTESLVEKADGEVTSNSFCRICLLKQPKLKPLLQRIDGVMIPEMLYKLCGRQIEVQDSYPKSVCERCLGLLDSAFSFLNLFHQQDEQLRSFYWNGSVLEQLKKYQQSEDNTVNKRLEAVFKRNGKIFTEPPKDVCTAGTMTDSPEVTSVGVNTDPKKETVEADEMDYEIEIEPEDGFIAYSDLGETDSEEQVLEMKIDLLNSQDPSDADERVRKRQAKIAHLQIARRAELQTMRAMARTKESEEDDPFDGMDEQELEEMDNGETDDQSQNDQDYEDSESRQDAEESLEVIDPFRCYICDHLAEGDAQLEEHLESHTLMLPYDCKKCAAEGANLRRFKTVSSLQNHFRSHHFQHRCDVCGRRFQRKSLLVTHREAHEENEYECEECGRKFSHRKTWHNHVQRHMAMRAEVFKCEVCEKVFGNKSRLVRHLQVHTGEKPFACRYCNKGFSDRHQLQCHTEKHIKDEECQCEECGETFPDHRRLDEHRIKQHLRGAELEEFLERKKKPPRRSIKLQNDRCPYAGCDYTAKTYGAMYVHKRTKHLSNIQCDLCNKTFAFMNQLKVHMKLHTGDKPFECEICHRKFRRSFSYREHMEMHKSDNSYDCMICEKSFKRPRYLQAHMLTHTSNRKFTCQVCGSSYKTNGELKKHCRNKHDMELVKDTSSQDGEVTNEVYVVEYV